MFRSFSVNIPKIPKKEFDLRAYGAIGDGRTSNTEAFRKAMEAAAAEGGRVIVPNGIWLTGPIRLLSNTALHLEDNAVILFDKDPERQRNDKFHEVKSGCIHLHHLAQRFLHFLNRIILFRLRILTGNFSLCIRIFQ